MRRDREERKIREKVLGTQIKRRTSVKSLRLPQNGCHSIFSRLNVSPASFQFTVLERRTTRTTLNPGAETRFTIDGLYLVSADLAFATRSRQFAASDKETSVLSRARKISVGDESTIRVQIIRYKVISNSTLDEASTCSIVSQINDKSYL